MPPPSKIALLPPEARATIDAWITDPRNTITDITERLPALLAEHGLEVTISRSAVGTYAQKLKQIRERYAQANIVAENWAGEFGDPNDSKVTSLLVNIVRTLAFDAAMDAQAGANNVTARDLKDLAVTVQKLEQAASASHKRALSARQAALEDAAAAVADEGKARGLTRETIELVQQKILRMGPEK